VGYLIYTDVGVLVFGLLIALWLHGIKRRRAVMMAIVLIPWAIPGTVNGEIWALIFKPTNGLLNGGAAEAAPDSRERDLAPGREVPSARLPHLDLAGHPDRRH